MRGCLIVNPVLFRVTHSMTAGNLACRSGLVDGTRTGSIAEGLGSVAALARIPLVNNHLDRHVASPYAGRAFFLVPACGKSPMTSFAVDRKRGWNTVPWGRLRFFLNIPRTDFQIANLIKLNGLKARIGNRQRITGYRVPDLEMVFGVSAFAHTDEKLSGFTSDTAAYPERISEIRPGGLAPMGRSSAPAL